MVSYLNGSRCDRRVERFVGQRPITRLPTRCDSTPCWFAPEEIRPHSMTRDTRMAAQDRAIRLRNRRRVGWAVHSRKGQASSTASDARYTGNIYLLSPMPSTNIASTRTLFEIDRGRLTCAGGVAALDMMHAIIRRDHGQSLAARVSDWYLQTAVRVGDSTQRLSLLERDRHKQSKSSFPRSAPWSDSSPARCSERRWHRLRMFLSVSLNGCSPKHSGRDNRPTLRFIASGKSARVVAADKFADYSDRR